MKATKTVTKELTPKPMQTAKKPTVTANSGVIVEDIGSCLLKFARCCTPVPGDPIVGFVTKGFGVSIHRQDCPNASAALMAKQPERWVRASWAVSSPEDPFHTSLEVECRDRDGLLLDIATVMSGMKVRLSEMNCRTIGDGRAVATLTFTVHDVNELNTICARIRNVSGVEEVRRGRS